MINTFNAKFISQVAVFFVCVAVLAIGIALSVLPPAHALGNVEYKVAPIPSGITGEEVAGKYEALLNTYAKEGWGRR
ncbi:MAG: hypothetical protein ACT4O2_13905 [Beijerinckiaceae bacterium]